jgi:uncharacterized protein (DUF58 family)
MASTFALHPRLLAATEDLPLLANLVVEGFLDGLHRSPFLGYSTEFSAYRAYVPGDNLRHIDWKVWARTDEYYVKQFEDDTNLRCQIYLDTSASMDFGAGDANKFLTARLLAAALAQLMVKQRDAPGLVLFGPESRQALPAQSTRMQAMEIFELLARAKSGGGTLLNQDLYRLVQTFSRRGLAVVISDFFTAEDASFDLLRQLHAQRQEVIVFHTLAPEELDLPYEGEYVMEDSETGQEVLVQVDDFREEYRRRVSAFCERVRKACIDWELDYHLVRSDQPLDIALIAYLEKRLAV